MFYPIPKSSAEAWEKNRYKITGQNAGLIFQRFAPIWGEGKEEAKKLGLKSVINAEKKADPVVLKEIYLRWQSAANFLHAEPFSLATEWRLIAGLGSKGPLEVGFTFDRYGFPTLPGSCLKGIARSMARLYLWEKMESPEMKLSDLDLVLGLPEIRSNDNHEKIFSEEWLKLCPRSSDDATKFSIDFRTIFGTNEKAGKAIFLQGIPDSSELPKLELDIMNPHFPKYYSESKAPTDSQNPIPIFFITVTSSTKFHFAVGWRSESELVTAEELRLRKLAETWLRDGLMFLGAGSKTSAGYGVFKLCEVKNTTHQPGIAVHTAQPQEPAVPAEPVTNHTGMVISIRPDRRYGRVKDELSAEEYSFSTDVLNPKGWTPSKHTLVDFALQGTKVIKVSRR